MLKISKVLILQVAKEIQWEVTQLKGYINNNKKLSFTASAYLDEKNQFEGYSST